MRAKLVKALVVFALICAVGGHWTVLQSVAWFGMAVSHSQNSTLKEALVKTFDGRHPCYLCRVVQEGKKSESKQTLLKVDTKLDFWLARSMSPLGPPPPFMLLPTDPGSAPRRAEPPPTPPPRTV